MTEITTYNYESYYLDYLEGNLNEEDTALLLNFLESHPELNLEHSELPSIHPISNDLEEDFKLLLKVDGLKAETISNENIDAFLIAELENQLDAQKQTELTSFLAKHPAYKQEQKRYKKTVLVPDALAIYPVKNGLKRKRVIALWPALTAAAAALVLLFIAYNWQEAKIHTAVAPMAHVEDSNGVSDPVAADLPSEKPSIKTQPGNKDLKTEDNSRPVSVKKTSPQLAIASLETKPLVELEHQVVHTNTLALNPLKEHTIPSVPKAPANTYVGFNDMSNPIEPVTSGLASIIKKEVDFKMAKPAEGKPSGFFLKIGQLEISRRKN